MSGTCAKIIIVGGIEREGNRNETRYYVRGRGVLLVANGLGGRLCVLFGALSLSAPPLEVEV